MTALVDLADILRSKNAGPFLLTIDVFFPHADALERALAPHALTATTVARLYGVAEDTVAVIPVPELHAVKITIPRPGSSAGGPLDRDVYGAQQHGPLLDLQIP